MTFNKRNEYILRIADGIVDTLKDEGFFEEHPFVGQNDLHKKLIQKMAQKYDNTGEILLTDKEFLKAANEVSEAAISETLGNLLDKDAIQMSIDKDGEIRYSANPDFDINSICEDEEE